MNLENWNNENAAELPTNDFAKSNQALNLAYRIMVFHGMALLVKV